MTKVIVTSSGLVITGIPVERGNNQLVLKDATGKHIKIATADIESEANGKIVEKIESVFMEPTEFSQLK